MINGIRYLQAKNIDDNAWRDVRQKGMTNFIIQLGLFVAGVPLLLIGLIAFVIMPMNNIEAASMLQMLLIPLFFAEIVASYVLGKAIWKSREADYIKVHGDTPAGSWPNA